MQNTFAGSSAEPLSKDQGVPTISVVLGEAPQAAALKAGAVRSDRVNLKFIGVNPIHTSFRPMVRELPFDVCEMAIITYLMAKDRGVPVTLIPAVMLAWQQHPHLLYNAERGVVSPTDLAGKRIGVRAYSQTTGAWVRGFLQNDYGVDLTKIHWITFEDAHVAGYREPPWVERAPGGRKIGDMLASGEIDAAIADLAPDPRWRTVIPDAKAVAQRWSEKHGGVPINHMVVVKIELLKTYPWLAEEIYRLLLQSKTAANLGAAAEPAPYGIEINRAALAAIAYFAFQQGLVSRHYEVDEMFHPTTREIFT